MDLLAFAKSLNGYRYRLIDIVLQEIEKNKEAIKQQASGDEGFWNNDFDLGCLGMTHNDLEVVNGYLSQFRLTCSLERRYVFGCIEDHTLLHW